MAKVIKQAIGKNGKSIGSWNESPIFSTLIYGIKFPDGNSNSKKCATNIIANNLRLMVWHLYQTIPPPNNIK